jgi:predicted nucleic acid-binding protein
MILLDTDVVVDIERGHPPALAWLASSSAREAALPGIAAFELVYGARNELEARRTLKCIEALRVLWPTSNDCQRALKAISRLRTSGIGVLDILIAQTAIGCDMPLASFNHRHFRAVPGLQLIRPYER